MEAEWAELRRDFPVCDSCAYLNTASAGPIPTPVKDAALRVYEEHASGADIHWDRWVERVEEARGRVARFIGAHPDEVAFVQNTSTGMNLTAELLEGTGPVIASELEFPAATLPWIQRGVPLHLIRARAGVIHPDTFAESSAPSAGIMVLSYVQFSNGCRQDLQKFGAIKGDRTFVVCGSQALGAFAIDVMASQVDVLCVSGHKWLCAGYGAGFLYLGRQLLRAREPRSVSWLGVESPFAFCNTRVSLVRTSRRAELGCPNFAGIFALDAAIRYLDGIGISRIAKRVLALNEYLREGLERAGFHVLSPSGSHSSGQLLCMIEKPESARQFLAQHKVEVTEKPQGLRISAHFFNNQRDIDACVAALSAYARKLRG